MALEQTQYNVGTWLL